MEPAMQKFDDNITTGFSSPPLPSTASEFITALAHFHRAEIARMAGWRDRIDRTSNWAITGVAAMLSLSLSTPASSHGVLLFAMIMILLLLLIEARRYRFFDVYRGRVRIIERNYFAQMFAPDGDVKEDWARALGQDLRKPEFLMSLKTAMARRLRRNYAWMFLILLMAWVLKITSPKLQDIETRRDVVASLQEIVGNAALGLLPGWLVLLLVAALYGWIAYATFLSAGGSKELSHGRVHV